MQALMAWKSCGRLGLLMLAAVVGCGAQADKPGSDAAGVNAERSVDGQRDLSVERTTSSERDQGRRWAVVVGVNRYLDPSIPSLRYSVADARRLAATLDGCGYESKRVLVVADDQTQEHLRPLGINLRLQIAQWLKHPEPGDTVVVFFSGHGFLDAAGQGYLAPSDCEKANLGLTGFRTDDLRNLLQQCRATQKLLVLDCCHAGGVKDIQVEMPSSQEVGAAFLKSEGLITLASCRKEELSREWDAKQQGLFTYYLTHGLAGAADFDGNRIVDSDELYRYTVDEVLATAQQQLNAAQTPVRLIGPEVVGVFALARLPARRASTAGVSMEAIVNSIGMKLVRIPAGEFMMGSGEEAESLVSAMAAYDVRPEQFHDEYPQHRVRITRPFCLGMYEVTVGQFRKFVTDTQYQTDAEKGGPGGAGYVEGKGEIAVRPQFNWQNPGFMQSDEHPVLNVSWDDATAFCEWLGRKEGKPYRLPTEAEWEYACRAGTTTRFSSGDDPESLARVGNVADAAAKAKFPDWKWTIAASDGCAFTAPVGRYQPNAFGLFDMHGNVWEWCADWYAADYYATSPADDPKVLVGGKLHVLRGGSWLVKPCSDRAACRFRYAPMIRADFAGFRVVQGS